MNALTLANLQTLTFGVEIEFVGGTQEYVGLCVAKTFGWGYSYGVVTMADGRKWTVMGDGSVSDSRHPMWGGELVSPILTWADLGMLKELVDSLKACGIEVNSTTGLHVHVGGLDKAEQVANLARLMANDFEALLIDAVKVRPSRLMRYCKPVEVKSEKLKGISTVAKLKGAWYGNENYQAERYDSSRYHGLNLNSWFFRKTVEFRYFNGTMESETLIAYVKLCMGLACFAKFGPTVRATPNAKLNRDWDRTTMSKKLARLGFSGSEFADVRKVILGGLTDRGAAVAA